MSKFFREPLVHFLVGALIIFLWFAVVDVNRSEDQSHILIDETQIKRLVDGWVQSWRQPPSPDQLAGLIENRIRDEVYYREGLRLGLDQDDPVVRNRMVQKMRFLQTAELAEASAPDLAKWLQENKANYRIAAKFSFEQLYLGQDANSQDAALWLAKLQAGEVTPQSIAQPLGLPQSHSLQTTDSIDRLFGTGFAAGLKNAQVGHWDGPVQSGFGMHLVRVTQFEKQQEATLSDESTRKRVKNDWRAAHKAALEARNLEQLKSRYSIEVVQPK